MPFTRRELSLCGTCEPRGAGLCAPNRNFIARAGLEAGARSAPRAAGTPSGLSQGGLRAPSCPPPPREPLRGLDLDELGSLRPQAPSVWEGRARPLDLGLRGDPVCPESLPRSGPSQRPPSWAGAAGGWGGGWGWRPGPGGAPRPSVGAHDWSSPSLPRDANGHTDRGRLPGPSRPGGRCLPVPPPSAGLTPHRSLGTRPHRSLQERGGRTGWPSARPQLCPAAPQLSAGAGSQVGLRKAGRVTPYYGLAWAPKSIC